MVCNGWVFFHSCRLILLQSLSPRSFHHSPCFFFFYFFTSIFLSLWDSLPMKRNVTRLFSLHFNGWCIKARTHTYTRTHVNVYTYTYERIGCEQPIPRMKCLYWTWVTRSICVLCIHIRKRIYIYIFAIWFRQPNDGELFNQTLEWSKLTSKHRWGEKDTESKRQRERMRREKLNDEKKTI